DRGLAIADELERRVDVPAGDVNVRTRRREALGDPLARLRTVDQDLDVAVLPRRWITRRPRRLVGVQRALQAVAAQTPPVVGRHEALDRVAGEGVDARLQARDWGRQCGDGTLSRASLGNVLDIPVSQIRSTRASRPQTPSAT